MGIKDFLKKRAEKQQKFKAMEEELRMQQKIEAKQKNSNEREWERFHEEARQAKIKKDLEAFREKQKRDFWQGENILNQRNIFKGHQSVLRDNEKFMGGTRMGKHPNMFFK